MSRRSGGRQPESPRNQPSPASSSSQQGGGRSRGGGGRDLDAPSLASSIQTSPSPLTPPKAADYPVATSPSVHSSSATLSSSASPPDSTAILAAALRTDVKERLSLQAPASPISSKAICCLKRPGYGTVGRKTVVRANHFLVEVSDRDLYHYDVSIIPEVTSREINRAVIRQLIKLYGKSHLGRRRPVYDGRKSLYAAGPFPFESMEFVVKLAENDYRTAPSGSARKERQFKVAIKLATKSDLHHLQEFLCGRRLDIPLETLYALHVVLGEAASQKYTVVGRSFFPPGLGWKGDGLEYWRGYYQSLRPTQMGLSLIIDASAEEFYEPILVTEFVAKHFNFNFTRQLSDNDRLKIKKALRGIKIEFTHTEYTKCYKVTGVSTQPTSQLIFTLNDKKTKKSVVQYFHERYNIGLQHVSLPALQAGSDANPIYLPMELCKIVSRQRYSKRLNEKKVTNLLRATCLRPQEREGRIKEMVRRNNFDGDVLLTEEFGIKVKDELTAVDARVLPSPVIRYHDTGREPREQPRMGQWNMMNKKMINGGRVDYWTCVNFSAQVHKDVPFDFCDQLINMCSSKGMVFNPEPLVPIRSSQSSQIERALIEIQKQCVAIFKQIGVANKQLQLLIIILPDAKGSYGKIKLICETELGIVSQCCQPRQASKSNNNQYLENVALKINVKVGGRNNVLNDAIQRKIPLLTDRPTIVFGAHVTHPQPMDCTSPSIAAVVASMDWPEVTRYRGIFSSQAHRQGIIQDLFKSVQDPQRALVHGGMIRELLIAFRKSTGHKPHRIIFYRDGVSAGQFSQVLLYEIDAIRKACLSLEEGYLPPITFVVVQKRHHTRLFPMNHNNRDQTDRSGNILPGTVVETKICHPTEFDFYLNSHAGIQGTSLPTHYHVLYDDNRFTADSIQMLTNNLCYTYARCTRSVSVVPPAYYAQLVAFRARYYIKDKTSDSGSTSGSDSRMEFRALPLIMDNVKEVMFYC